MAVADGEADIALQNSHIISYHLQNPRFTDLKILSLFNFPDNLCLAAANNADGNQLLTIFNKCIDTLNPKTLDNIVMYETVQSPYQPLLSDLAYKYNYLIAALLAVLIILLPPGFISLCSGKNIWNCWKLKIWSWKLLPNRRWPPVKLKAAFCRE